MLTRSLSFIFCRFKLAAFVALWLSVYVFPGGPEEGVNPRLFLLAIRIAKGERFALAPFYLGSFYRRLDLYHHASVRSKGRYVIYSHVDLMFLQLFIYERFHEYTCQVGEQDSQGSISRVMAPLNRRPVKLLSNVIDDVGKFIFRPYLIKKAGYEDCSKSYPDRADILVTLIDAREKVDIFDAGFILWCTPGYLPSLQDSKNSVSCFMEQRVMVYSPHRVARQFGFDQGVPRLISPSQDFNYCCQLLSPKDMRFIYPDLRQLFFPSVKRSGVPTAGWLAYWMGCLERFKKYAFAVTGDILEAPPIHKYEFYLVLPSLKSTNLPSSSQVRSKTKCASQVKSKKIQDCQGNTSVPCETHVKSKIVSDSKGKHKAVQDSREKATNQAKRICVREVPYPTLSIFCLYSSSPFPFFFIYIKCILLCRLRRMSIFVPQLIVLLEVLCRPFLLAMEVSHTPFLIFMAIVGEPLQEVMVYH